MPANRDDFWEQSAPAPLPFEKERQTVTVSVNDLEEALTRAVRSGLNDAIRHATSDEQIRAFWRRGWAEMSSHGGAAVREGVGGAVLKWGAGILAAAGLALWLRFGPWK
jgi:hypothetical protein